MNPTHSGPTLPNLAGFTGSGTVYRWSVLNPNHRLSQGAQAVAEQAQAYWLMDLIGSWQHDPKVRGEDFQVWTLTKRGDGFLAQAEDGNGHVIARQFGGFTDFPFPVGNAFTLWAERNELGGVTILLPSEH